MITRSASRVLLTVSAERVWTLAAPRHQPAGNWGRVRLCLGLDLVF